MNKSQVKVSPLNVDTILAKFKEKNVNSSVIVKFRNLRITPKRFKMFLLSIDKEKLLDSKFINDLKLLPHIKAARILHEILFNLHQNLLRTLVGFYRRRLKYLKVLKEEIDKCLEEVVSAIKSNHVVIKVNEIYVNKGLYKRKLHKESHGSAHINKIFYTHLSIALKLAKK